MSRRGFLWQVVPDTASKLERARNEVMENIGAERCRADDFLPAWWLLGKEHAVNTRTLAGCVHHGGLNREMYGITKAAPAASRPLLSNRAWHRLPTQVPNVIIHI